MKGRIALTLFALPFLAVGVWMSWSIASAVTDALAMRDWQPVEARLLAAGYHRHSGDDSTTYEAYAQYAYNLQGQSYTGRRVALAGGSDNIGEYQRNLGRRLSGAMARGEAVTVYIDPEDPQNAVIDRNLRWGLIGFESLFVLLFGGAGIGLLILVWRRPSQKDAADARHEDAPWLRNDAWQSATVRSSSKGTMWTAWLITAVWNLVSAPLPFVVWREVADDNHAALAALLFPLVGIGLLLWAIRRTLEWRRFGPAPVTLDPFPGSIGGHVGGTIDVNLPFDPAARFEVTITCLRSYVSGSGKNRRRRERAEWQDRRLAHVAPGPRGTRLRFRCDVPPDLHESDAVRDSSAYYLWRLNLAGQLPGIDIDRDYDIPVYATATKSRLLPERILSEATSAQDSYAEENVRRLFRFERSGAGGRLYYPPGRHLAAALGGFAVGSILAGMGWYFAFREGSPVFGSVFGGFGALIAAACLYTTLNSLDVYQEGTAIVALRRLFGIPIRRRRMERHAFVRFDLNSRFKSQSGSKHVVYYALEAVDRYGNRMTVGEGFRGASEASAAMRFIARELGLRPAAAAAPAPSAPADNVLATDR